MTEQPVTKEQWKLLLELSQEVGYEQGLRHALAAFGVMDEDKAKRLIVERITESSLKAAELQAKVEQ